MLNWKNVGVRERESKTTLSPNNNKTRTEKEKCLR